MKQLARISPSILCLFLLGLFSASPASAAEAEANPASEGLRLPAILGDNMVLQIEEPARIWGWAKPDAEVKVEIAGQAKTTKASAEGTWEVKLDPLKADKSPQEMKVTSSGKTITVKNILFGDVWLASGQSNMHWALKNTKNSRMAIKEADFPELRLFKVAFYAPVEPQVDVEGKWVVCTPETAQSFSAVAFYFGRELLKETGRPIGLIHSSVGGTKAESWTPLDKLKSDATFANIMYKYENRVKDPLGFDSHTPSALYNGMIHALTPLTIKGVIWYQGESNGGMGFQYRTLFPAMITSWREAFGQELPFYFVQLANFMKPPEKPVEEPWAELREAQTMTLALPKTGMAVAIDVGDEKNIHPGEKRSVGERLSRWALVNEYGKELVPSGPLYAGMEKKGDAITISFKHIGAGLVAKDGPLKQFAIAGEDKKFVWADAKIEGDTVVVSSPEVKAPVAVRYAWANNPEGANLYNKEGLPAVPFRTDDWPGTSDKKHIMTPEQLAKKANLPTPQPPPAPGTEMTGNTLEIRVGKRQHTSWEKVKVSGYEYVPTQLVKNGVTTVYLPFGSRAGSYFELKGFEPKDASRKGAITTVAQGPEPAVLAYKFHFDQPVAGFGLDVGLVNLQGDNGELVIDYSTDGKAWTPIATLAKPGNSNQTVSSKETKFENLDTRDLTVRLRFKAKEGKQLDASDKVSIRTAGDPSWGDASRTFAASQIRLTLWPMR